MSIEKLNDMATRFAVTRVQLADGGTYVPAYIDPQGMVIYLLRPVRMKWEQVPFRGPISGLKVIPVEELTTYRIIEIVPPVRYLVRREGKVEAGYFEPKLRVFYKLRGGMPTDRADPKVELRLSPADLRELTVVEIDPAS